MTWKKLLAGPGSVQAARAVGGSEKIASRTIANVEAVADDGKPHGVSAVQQLTVFDRLNAKIVGNRRGPPAVPARAVARLGLSAVHTGSLRLLRHVAGRQRGALTEEKILHVLGNQ